MTEHRAYRSACLMASLVAITVGVIIAGGCGSTQLVNLWRDPAYKAAPMHKIMVVAMRKNQIRRRMWEDAFVAALGKQQAGTVTAASYQLFPNEIPDTSVLVENLREQGFEGVLVVARVEGGKLISEIPGYTATEPVTEYKRRWNTYVTRYEDVYHPGYTDTATVVSVRTDLLLAQEDGRLVWSATSKSIDPASAEQFRKAVADKVADQLAKARLIP
jgi:hypothetical protein